MGFHRDLARELARAQNLEPVVYFVDDTRRHQRIGRERVSFELLQPAEVDDGVPLFENVGESALRQPAMQRHLSAFESALLAKTGPRVLSLGPARGRLAVSRSHTAPDA